MDKKLPEIIEAVSREMEIGIADVFFLKNTSGKNARLILSYVVDNFFKYRRDELANLFGCNLMELQKRSDRLLSAAYDNIAISRLLNNVCKRLDIPAVDVVNEAVERDKRRNGEPKGHGERTYYKSPLGFTYTERDEVRCRKARREAALFMMDYGKGVTPLMEGFATQRR